MKYMNFNEFISAYTIAPIDSSLISIKITFNKEGKKEVSFLKQIKKEILEKNEIIKGIQPIPYEGYKIDFREGYNIETYYLIHELHEKIKENNIVLKIIIHSKDAPLTPDA